MRFRLHFHRPCALHALRASPPLIVAASAAFMVTLAGCRQERETANAQNVGESRDAIIAVPKTPYRPGDVPSPGSISGTVTYTGVAPADSILQIPAEQNGCAKPLTIPQLERSNGAVSDVVVWLRDIRTGRGLPLDRRFAVSNSECRWSPTVQVVLAGGTLNVVNHDPLVDRVYLTDVAEGDTLAQAPFTDQGQVIPYFRPLKTPRLFELSVESRPMSRAWVAVLDHPYFAVTKADGQFRLDGVPPGTYQLRAWHPLLGVIDAKVTVAAGQAVTTNLSFATPSDAR